MSPEFTFIKFPKNFQGFPEIFSNIVYVFRKNAVLRIHLLLYHKTERRQKTCSKLSNFFLVLLLINLKFSFCAGVFYIIFI